MGAQPANKLHPSLRGSAQPDREFLDKSSLPPVFTFFFTALLSTFLLLEILNSFFFVELLVRQDHQVVGQRNQVPLHRLGGFGTGPCLLLIEAVLHLIKHFFNIPSHPVKMSQQPRLKSHLIGNETMLLPRGGVLKFNHPHEIPTVGTGTELTISKDSVVDWSFAIPGYKGGRQDTSSSPWSHHP